MHLTSDSFPPPNSGILEEEVDDFDNSATIKAKNFFHSCMDMSKQEWSNLVGRDAPFWEIHQAQGPLENTPKSAFLVIIFGHFLSEMAFKGHFRQTVPRPRTVTTIKKSRTRSVMPEAEPGVAVPCHFRKGGCKQEWTSPNRVHKW